MKICYLITTADTAAGANRSLLNLMSALKDDGNQYYVIAPAHGKMEEEVNKRGAKYIVYPYRYSVKASNKRNTYLKRLYNWRATLAIKKFLTKERIDVFHNNSVPNAVGMNAAHMAGIPYICHIRENVWDGTGMEFYNSNNIRRLIRDAYCVITISDYLRRTYISFEPNGNYVTINDGISIDDYYDEREIFAKDEVNIAIIGMINPQKDQFEAIRALEVLRERDYSNLHLDIIGDGCRWKGSSSYILELKQYVENKRLMNVSFLPPIYDMEDLRKARRKYDINLVCSWAEGLGRVTIESMLAGSLTIAADAGATSEILRNGEQGLLYKKGDYVELADKLEYALKNRDKMRRIARQAQIYAAERFNPDAYALKIKQIYNAIQMDQSINKR